jgi:hypothetical protein
MAVDAARAKTLFLAAADLASPAERAAYLDRECGGEAELRARIEALLAADAGEVPFPEPDATGILEATVRWSSSTASRPPSTAISIVSRSRPGWSCSWRCARPCNTPTRRGSPP